MVQIVVASMCLQCTDKEEMETGRGERVWGQKCVCVCVAVIKTEGEGGRRACFCERKLGDAYSGREDNLYNIM